MGLFVAALRETFEEAGVLLARGGGADLPGLRARLAAGETFGALIDGAGLELTLEALVPHARWITPVVERRRYDTRFFFAVHPTGQTAEYDRHETTAGAWMAPRGALDKAKGGEIQLPPPTMRTLEILDAFGSVEQAVGDARSRPTPLVAPVFHDEQGTFVLALPGDPAHPEAEPVIPGSTRFVLDQGRWWSRDPATRG